MNEIKRFEFEGKPLTLTRRDDSPEWWANGDEVAAVLGYEDKRSVADLFKRHAVEFLDSETCVLDLRTSPEMAATRAARGGGKLAPRGNALRVRLYSLRGVEHLAILGRTETCIRFRRWVLDLLERLRGEQLAAFEQRVAALEARADEAASVELELLDIHLRSGRALASAFAARAGHPRVKERIEARRADLNDLDDMRRGQARLFRAPVTTGKGA